MTDVSLERDDRRMGGMIVRVALVLLLAAAPASAVENPCYAEDNVELYGREAAGARRRVEMLRARARPEEREALLRAEQIAAERQRNAEQAVDTLRRCQERVKAEEERRKRDAAETARVEAEKAAAEAARRARVQARVADPKWVSPLFSSLVCSAKRDRDRAVAEIAKERKYGRIGGVVDLQEIHDWQGAVREADERLARHRGEAKRRGARLLPCTDKLVGVLAQCVSDADDIEHPVQCKEPPLSEYLELLK